MIYECYIVGGELYHHGIKGQKWGKKNGPPYPLGASAHSSSEKKAGWRSSLKEGNAEGPSNVPNNRNRRNFRNNVQKKSGTNVYNITNNYNKPTKPKNFSDKTVKEIINEQKNFNEKAIVAGAVTLGAIATIAAGAGIAKTLSAKGESEAAKVIGKVAGKTLDMAKRSAENNIFNIGVAAVAAMGLGVMNRNASNNSGYQNQSGMKNLVNNKNQYQVPEKLKVTNNMSGVTKKIIENYNNMNDIEFKNKYHTTKEKYAKDVEKYGDPYKHVINSKSYKLAKKYSKTKIANNPVKKTLMNTGIKMAKAARTGTISVNKKKNK